VREHISKGGILYYQIQCSLNCHALQCIAVRCSVLQCVIACCSALQRAVVHCSVLQRVAASERAYLQRWHPQSPYSVLPELHCVAGCCSMLQGVALYCSVLQRAAVLYSVLQCVTASERAYL